MSYHILIVDDEPDLEHLVKQKFRKHIRKGEFEFSSALDGYEALNKLIHNGQIDLVLTDINMPRMDGLTLLKEIRNLNNPILKTIIVSAYGDMQNIRTAMNLGAFDFITKPINFQDLEITIHKTLHEIENAKQALQTRDEYNFIQNELNIAREIQMSILPSSQIPLHKNHHFDLSARIITAQEVGGDFYDYFMINDHLLGFVIGDVSGKGIPASILMAVCKTSIKTIAKHDEITEDCFYLVNNALLEECINDLFVTAFFGMLNTQTGEVKYYNAGHNETYILRSTGEVEAVPEVNGIPLGFRKNYPYEQGKINLEKGDMVFLHTDGINEAMNGHDEEFSENRIITVLNNFSGNSMQNLNQTMLDEVSLFCDSHPQSDDMTVMGIKYL